MESNRRKQFKDYQTKIEIFETVMEQVNSGVLGSVGNESYDIPEDELENLGYWDKQEHIIKDEEGLVIYNLPYPDLTDDDDSWKSRQNYRYELTKEALKVVRTALEKWLDK